VHHKWDQTDKPPNLKIGDFVTVPQEKILKTRWPIARITGFVEDSSGIGRKKAAFIETYVSDRVNTRLKDQVFGEKTRIKDLTPDQKKRVVGCFIPNKNAVKLTNLYPYELWENTDVDFPVSIGRDSLPTNFPGHKVVFTDDLANFHSQKVDRERRRDVNKQLAAVKAAVKKRARAPILRDDVDRPRRKTAKYDQNYRALAAGNLPD
jgi:hypothetical protein